MSRKKAKETGKICMYPGIIRRKRSENKKISVYHDEFYGYRMVVERMSKRYGMMNEQFHAGIHAV